MKNSRFIEFRVSANLMDDEKYVKLIKKYLMNNARIILHKVTRYARSSLFSFLPLALVRDVNLQNAEKLPPLQLGGVHTARN